MSDEYVCTDLSRTECPKCKTVITQRILVCGHGCPHRHLQVLTTVDVCDDCSAMLTIWADGMQAHPSLVTTADSIEAIE